MLDERKVRNLYFGGLSTWAYLTFCGIACVGFAVLLVVLELRAQKQSSEAVEVLGQIEDRGSRKVQSRRGVVTQYWVKFTYSSKDGRTFSKTQDVDEPIFAGATVGRSIRLEYLASAPDDVRIIGTEDSTVMRWILLGASLMFGGTLIALFVSRTRLARRATKLMLEGKPILGTVKGLVKKRGNDSNLTLEYSFTDDAGQPREGSLRLPAKAPKDWMPNQPILVLVDQVDPTNSIPDVFGVRQHG